MQRSADLECALCSKPTKHIGVQIDETASVSCFAAFCLVATHSWGHPRAVESAEPSPLGTAGGRRSAGDAAKWNAEAASLLGLHHSSALFAGRDISLPSAVLSHKGQLPLCQLALAAL